jgi:hypothetical protein
MDRRQQYEDAWTKLLSARRIGRLEYIQKCAEELSKAALELERSASQHFPCSHFMVANGHCMGCGEKIERSFHQNKEVK